MIKRKLAILLFTVANIALLAHSAIPHHHHGSAVCFNQSHCIPKNTNHDQGSTGHSHDNETSGTEEYCILYQVFIAPASQVSPGQNQVTSSADFSWTNDSFPAVLPGNIQIPLLQNIAGGGQPPFHDNYTCLAHRSLSLRAPPAV